MLELAHEVVRKISDISPFNNLNGAYNICRIAVYCQGFVDGIEMMDAFFTEILVIGLAILTVFPIAKVFHFSKRIEPLVIRFAKIKPFEKILVSLFLLATLCMGSTKSSSSTNSPSPRQSAPRSQRTQGRSTPTSLPQWYLAFGYNTTDTDEDGIPDIWEKWTRTKPKVYDSKLDADGDGLTNLKEFMNQLDPRHPDTDGDGLDDALELRRMVDGDVAFIVLAIDNDAIYLQRIELPFCQKV